MVLDDNEGHVLSLKASLIRTAMSVVSLIPVWAGFFVGVVGQKPSNVAR